MCPEDSTRLFAAFHARGIMSGKSTKGPVLNVQSAVSLRRVPSGRDDAFDMRYTTHIYHVSCRTHRKIVPSVSCSLACWHVLLSVPSTARRIYLGTVWSTVLPTLKQEMQNMQLDMRGGNWPKSRSKVLNGILFHPKKEQLKRVSPSAENAQDSTRISSKTLASGLSMRR